MEFVEIGIGNRAEFNEFIREHWFTTEMVVRGRVVDMTKASGIAAMDDGKIAGLLTYEMSGERCEILSLDSVVSCRGVGTALLERLKETAREAGCRRIVLITTNDNIEALYFYQRRGFDLAHIYRNALDVSRRLKPEIPTTGEHGIPLRHEIEFEMAL